MHTFLGPARHPSEFSTGTPVDRGRKVVVIGTGVSGHDIDHDLYRYDANVTLVQRSPNYVITLSSVLAMMKHRYDEGKVTEDSDLLAASIPATVFNRIGGDAARLFQKRDQHILDGLESAGFALDTSLPSLLSLTIHRAGGFYIDSGGPRHSSPLGLSRLNSLPQSSPSPLTVSFSTVERRSKWMRFFLPRDMRMGGYERGRSLEMRLRITLTRFGGMMRWERLEGCRYGVGMRGSGLRREAFG